MLRLTCLALLLATGAMAQDQHEWEEYQGSSERVHLNMPTTECTSADPGKIVFNLYTRESPFNPKILRINDEYESISRSGYNGQKPTKFLIHGYMQTANETREMVPSYLYWNDVNVIAVDWSEYSKKCNLNSTQNVAMRAVSVALSKLMKKIIAYGSTAEENFHVVGYGVGAHIAAQAAKKLFPIKLNRISALDPTGLGFDAQGRRKLQNSDAHFVDVLYTSGPHIASGREIGHVNVYPNGGKHPQPGCTNAICSSRFSIDLWKSSISKPLKAWKCDNYVEYKASRCTGNPEYVGEHVSQGIRGKFFVDVADPSSPSYD